jgi:hypothetical protein
MFCTDSVSELYGQMYIVAYKHFARQRPRNKELYSFVMISVREWTFCDRSVPMAQATGIRYVTAKQQQEMCFLCGPWRDVSGTVERMRYKPIASGV